MLTEGGFYRLAYSEILDDLQQKNLRKTRL